MDTLSLKQELIHRITNINDFDLLNELKTILELKNNEDYLELAPELEKELLEASVLASNGETLSQDELDKKVDKWLSEK